MNEIEVIVDGRSYRVTNLNNGNKYDRAKKDAGSNVASKKILSHYDKLAGNIQDSGGKTIPNGQFWKEEKERQEKKEIILKKWQIFENIIRHPVISGLLVAGVCALVAYYFHGF